MSKKKYKKGSRIYTVQELLVRLERDGVIYMHFLTHDKVQNKKWILNMRISVVIGMLYKGTFYAVEPN